MKYKKEVYRSFTLISQLGISVMVPVFMCIFLGLFIDKHLGTSLTVWLMFLGILAGGRNAYILAKSVIHENERDKEAKR
jgi:ATP synthase protein I